MARTKKIPYDSENDFTPVTNLVLTNHLIVAIVPFNTFRVMIANLPQRHALIAQLRSRG